MNLQIINNFKNIIAFKLRKICKYYVKNSTCQKKEKKCRWVKFLIYAVLYIFFIWKTYLANKVVMRYMVYYLYIFNIIIKFSWKLRKIFLNRNNICPITIFTNRNNFHYFKLWQIGIGIYLWPKYQRIDSWRIYLQTICELFANRELFAEHCTVLYCTILYPY